MYLLKCKGVVLVKSLIYNRKSKGPKIDPWGTPHLVGKETGQNIIIHYILFSVR